MYLGRNQKKVDRQMVDTANKLIQKMLSNKEIVINDNVSGISGSKSKEHLRPRVESQKETDKQ